MAISKEELKVLDGYFRAVNYLTAGQLYLLDNPLLERPLDIKDVKKKVVGHWGTCPGQNFIYTHCNRVITRYNLDMIYLSGPGHGGNSIVSNVYLEGTYSEVYPTISEDVNGLKKLFKQFSFPGGINSHVAPDVPGSIHEGGELGYSLAHACGAIFDNPDLIATCVVGDGEAETGPLATSWMINKFINPITDGAVLPILHLNGYKISNPTVLSRIPNDELKAYFFGSGWQPYIVSGDNQMEMHEAMARTMDQAIEEIKYIQEQVRTGRRCDQKWPMIILRTPKGWTGPKEVDGNVIEDSFRAHQVPIDMSREHHLELLESWLRSYRPQELFNRNGSLKDEYRLFIPRGQKRMGSSPHANGGILRKDLILPDLNNYGIKVVPGETTAEDTKILGTYLRDIIKMNPDNYRLFGPDETKSNRLDKVFETTNRVFNLSIKPQDEFVAAGGRVVDSMLSEHLCEGWLEGYVLTGRHGLFSSYEAFARVVDSMLTQHTKWLKMTSELPWRKSISSINVLLTSHIWQQDHNGYTHQDPGILGHLADKKGAFVNAYLPADSNTLLSVMEHCYKSKDCINAIVASKKNRPQWLNIHEASVHVKRGISIWDFASNDQYGEPDVILACCGDAPTLEMMAVEDILRRNTDIKIRFINVVNLFKLFNRDKHPSGLTDHEFNSLFTKDKPVVFAFHGYEGLLRNLLYDRDNKNFSFHAYREEGRITTPFDMKVLNKVDRFNLVKTVIKMVPRLKNNSELISYMDSMLNKHNEFIKDFGEDIPEVEKFKWTKK